MNTLKLKPIKTKSAISAISATAPEEVVEPLNPGARVFLEPQLKCFIIAELGCKINMDVQVLKEWAKDKLLKHPRSSSKLVFDDKENAVGWVLTEVNLDDHFIIPDLDSNIDSPDQFVEDYISNITKTPMDFSRPLWEVHILNIKTSKANSVCIFRIHHSIGDGISLISLLLACTRKTSDPDALPTLPINDKNKKNAFQPNTAFGIWGYFLLVLLLLQVLWNTLVDIVLFTATVVGLKDTNTPLKGKHGIEKAPKRIVHKTVSLDDIKLVKNAMGSTINDVVLGITQAGLSRYLNRSYGKGNTDETVHNTNLPNNIRLRATLIVNLRPTATIEGLAEMMQGESKGGWKWGNAIGYILLPFHIGLKNDPLDYIRNAKATIDRKKRSLEAYATYASAKLMIKTLGIRAATGLSYKVFSNTTMSFSNVVGPMEEVTFYGHPMAYLAPSVYGHPHALTVHFQSYMDKMTIVLAVDIEVIPDPHKLCDDIIESLQLCKDAIIHRNLVSS